MAARIHSSTRWDWLKNLTVKRQHFATAFTTEERDGDSSNVWVSENDELPITCTPARAVAWVVDGLTTEGCIKSFADLDYLRVSVCWRFFNRFDIGMKDVFVHDLDKGAPCFVFGDGDDATPPLTTCPCLDGDEDGCSAGIHIPDWADLKRCNCAICAPC